MLSRVSSDSTTGASAAHRFHSMMILRIEEIVVICVALNIFISEV
jgi:hypothetical protein